MASIARQLIHVTDWMPTLMSLAGYPGDPSEDLGLDGIDQWEAISSDEPSRRTEMVYNLRIDPVQGAIRVGDFKIIFGKKFNKQGWYDVDTIALQCNRLRSDKKLKRKLERKKLETRVPKSLGEREKREARGGREEQG